MKLRLYENSLRLRVSQGEAAQLASKRKVENTLSFGPGRDLRYSLESGPFSTVSAALEEDHIHVMLPQDVASRWLESDQVGVEARHGSLHILVEKDFQCLHRDSPEDADSFPNPDRRR